uniref:Uncharacterized protein n=1 Tax=Arundo donax TaxID=35708 RepID=A0A0A9BRC4_ARUDO
MLSFNFLNMLGQIVPFHFSALALFS